MTGINLSAYGKDNGSSLGELMKMLSKYDFSVRLGSLEVNLITKEFLDATKLVKRFCPHFHLSLQSGDDSVLKAMNRHYTCDEYYNAVKLIRQYYSDPAITTDIIVGFPSETEEEFENSMNFARKVAFSDIHVFTYSSRKGTVAGRMKTLAPDVVLERQKRMSALKHELATNYLKNKSVCPSTSCLKRKTGEFGADILRTTLKFIRKTVNTTKSDLSLRRTSIWTALRTTR